MSAIASSRINKSGKKFAPKAPVRRAVQTRASSKPASSLSDGAVEAPIEPQHSPPPAPIDAQDQPTDDADEPPVAPLADPESSPRPFGVPIVQSSEGGHRTDGTAVAIPIPKSVTIPPPVAVQPSATSQIQAHTPSGVPVIATPVSVTTKNHEQIVDENVETPSASPEKKRKRDEESKGHPSKKPDIKRRRPSQGANEVSQQSTASVQQDILRKRSTRAKRSNVTASTDDNAETSEAQDVSTRAANTRAKQSRPKKKPTKKNTQEVADDIVAEASGETSANVKARKKRQATPEDAESHEITTTAVTMADLIKDTRLGKKSEREKKLQSTDWEEVKRKRKVLEEARLNGPREDLPVENAPPPVPQLAVVNGQLVAVEGSQYVDSGVIDESVPAAINEDDIVNRVNSGTLGRKKNHLGRNKWDEEMTQLFYRGLRMFGTDFSMICQMFPGMSRGHVKSKFVKEERANLQAINDALLGPREQANLTEISQMNNVVYGDVAEFERTLEQDRKKEEAEHAKAEVERLKQANLIGREGDGDTAADGSLSAAGIVDETGSGVVSGARKGRRGRMALKKNARHQALAGGGDAVILGPINEP